MGGGPTQGPCPPRGTPSLKGKASDPSTVGLDVLISLGREGILFTSMMACKKPNLLEESPSVGCWAVSHFLDIVSICVSVKRADLDFP